VPAEPEQAEVQDVRAGADEQVADAVVAEQFGRQLRDGNGGASQQWDNRDGGSTQAAASAASPSEGQAVLVSVVVPCYRSAKTLPRLVEDLSHVLPEATTGFEIVLVVDGSPDDTWQVASELANKYPETRALRLARNYGQHNALIAGVRSARYEVVVTMDDDLQHPADQVPLLLQALTDDVDLVYGVPKDEEHGVVRSFASRMVKAAMASTLSVQNAKSISAFRAFRTFLRDGFDGLDGPHASVDVALSWSTTRIAQTTVRMEDRAEGRSNYTTWMLMKHALTLITGYSTEPLRLVGYLGFICAVFGVGLFGVIIYKYAVGATTVAGFTTIASMVALFSGAQMLALAVLGEYVGRLHSGSMGRPTYVIRERTDGDAHPDITTETD
jgi:undecaprenyl-phosphate 4-deoxy-4-formamido-L-arabinose transferase